MGMFQLDAWLDDLAEATVLADPSDERSIQKLLSRLSLPANASIPLELGPISVAATGTLLGILSGESEDPEGALSSVSVLVDQLQEAVRKGLPLPVPTSIARAVPSEENRAEDPAAAKETAGPAATAVERDQETVELFGDFLQEAEEGLAVVDEILVAAERSPPDKESINALFRVFHTIKGVAGFLELESVASLAHITETLLNQAREGQRDLQGVTLDLVFDGSGGMRKLLEGVREGIETGTAFPDLPEIRAIAARIEREIESPSAPVSEPDAHIEEPAIVRASDILEAPADLAPVDATPPAPISTAAEPVPAPLQPTPGQPPRDEAPAPVPPPSPTQPRREPEAPAAAGGARVAGARIRETLKVDVERVDSMVEMIGELIIVESMVVHAPEIAAVDSLKVRNYLSQLTKISRDLQDVAMRMRMVPVQGVFLKMQRMVRELSRKTGKTVELIVTGEGTEMDRSMVERIEDPLVHMIRNAMDHGLEPSADRRAAGKSETGIIRLSAFHEGGSVVVEIADDGRGLDRERILDKAQRQGIVREGEHLSDSEIYMLIFAPGFSTAAQVTEISGRGVGMDVVKRNIEAMRGRVMVSSTPGKGSVFKLILPLTLAIIDGMIVACGSERYIIPSLSIVESLQPPRDMISMLAGQQELLNVRGEMLPLFRLSKLFGIDGAQEDATQALVVVVESMGRKVGLLVDDVVTQQQVVIKPLGSGMGDSETFSGGAILSDGKVGLILNIDRVCANVGRVAHHKV